MEDLMISGKDRYRKNGPFLLSFLLLLALFCFGQQHAWALDDTTHTPDLPLIPWPANLHLHKGIMVLHNGGRILAKDKALLPLAEILANETFLVSGVRLSAGSSSTREGDISLQIDPNLHGDAYTF